jgi:hypothetical protein
VISTPSLPTLIILLKSLIAICPSSSDFLRITVRGSMFYESIRAVPVIGQSCGRNTLFPSEISKKISGFFPENSSL